MRKLFCLVAALALVQPAAAGERGGLLRRLFGRERGQVVDQPPGYDGWYWHKERPWPRKLFGVIPHGDDKGYGGLYWYGDRYSQYNPLVNPEDWDDGRMRASQEGNWEWQEVWVRHGRLYRKEWRRHH